MDFVIGVMKEKFTYTDNMEEMQLNIAQSVDGPLGRNKLNFLCNHF